MKLFPVALAFVAVVGLTPIMRADGFPRQTAPTATVPIDPAGLAFELHLPEGKTRFQQGETIPLRLLFSNRGTQTLYLNTPFYSLEITPRDGFSNPLVDLPEQTFFVYEGPPPPAAKALGKKSVEEPFILNERGRFDRPGTYQIHATTNAVFAPAKGQPIPRDGFFFVPGPSISSNSVSIEIVPADPKWQQAQVDAWRAYWAKLQPDFIGWSNPKGAPRPLNDLRFLNTRVAAQAIINRLGQDEFPRSSGSEAYYSWRSGLIGFSDRLWLIGAMKDALKRPDYPVTQGFLENLSTLQALYHVARAGQKTPPEQFAQVKTKADLANWQLTQASLSPKQGRARAMTVHSLLETAWFSSLSKRPEVQRQLPRLVAMVPEIFDDLPTLPQQYLLDDKNGSKEWAFVKSPRMVSPLLRAWKRVPREDAWARERGDLILRHLNELAPKVARTLILQEMASPQPRVSFEVLSLLGDKYLPQLQNIWWTHLNSNDADDDNAALLIGRYADATLKAKVQKEYDERKRTHMLSDDVSRGLKRYLSRV